jgi:hypothetical protein
LRCTTTDPSSTKTRHSASPPPCSAQNFWASARSYTSMQSCCSLPCTWQWLCSPWFHSTAICTAKPNKVQQIRCLIDFLLKRVPAGYPSNECKQIYLAPNKLTVLQKFQRTQRREVSDIRAGSSGVHWWAIQWHTIESGATTIAAEKVHYRLHKEQAICYCKNSHTQNFGPKEFEFRSESKVWNYVVVLMWHHFPHQILAVPTQDNTSQTMLLVWIIKLQAWIQS